MTAVRRIIPKAPINVSQEFTAFAMDPDTAGVIEQALSSTDVDGDVQVVGALSDIIDYLSALPTPRILLIDLGSTTDVMAAIEQLSEVCDPDVRVVLLGEVNDLHLYRELLSLGIADYLVKPVSEPALSAVFDKLNHRRPDAVEAERSITGNKTGHVVAVIGARGGAGASMIASNIAMGAAQSKQVTLIDMDLTFGTQAVTFDVDPGAGLSDAMMEPGRMDELFIKRASTRIGERLQLMAAETDPSRGDITSVDGLTALLGYVCDQSDWVVVDLPRSAVVRHPGMLEQVQTVLLVAEPTLPAMRDCARLKSLVAKINPEAKVSVILNKTGIAGKEELPTSIFEEGASVKVTYKIVFDPKTALSAEAHGKCMIQVAPKSKIAKDLTAICSGVMGDPKTQKRRGLGSLFALKGLGRNKPKPETT